MCICFYIYLIISDGMNNIKFEGKGLHIILTCAGQELKHILNLHSI